MGGWWGEVCVEGFVSWFLGGWVLGRGSVGAGVVMWGGKFGRGDLGMRD